QHAAYVHALADLGCQVIELPEELELPDSVFVEDTAFVLPEVASSPVPAQTLVNQKSKASSLP
ncbi:MAG: dimethylargininase, partial [Chloroflexota bacterium]